MEESIPKAKNQEKVRKSWAEWKDSGKFTFRHFLRNSGFAVLEIDDEKVVAHYYTNTSASPALTLKLLTNR